MQFSSNAEEVILRLELPGELIGEIGERIYLVPSEHLVVARFGCTTGRNFGHYAHVGLIAAVISALNR